jgi:CBS domain-containing protein
MSVTDYCTTRVETLRLDATAAEASRLMRDRGIGAVVVHTVDGPGIVTDRDLVVRVLAERRDPKRLRLAEIVSAPAATLSATASLAEAATLMRERAVRRLPVVGSSDEIVGIITYDDLVDLLGRELSDIAAVARGSSGAGDGATGMGGP